MLSKGKKAPPFTALDQNGQPISLSDFRGQKVALFFYPKDNTPGCTELACNLRDNVAALKAKGLAVIGVSVDSVRRHKNFEKKFGLPFPLVADVEQKIVGDYEVWGEKKMWGRSYMGIFRTTFLIDEKGIIRHVIDKVDTADHADQILKTWKL